MGDAAHCEGHDYHSIIVHFSMSHSDNPYFGRHLNMCFANPEPGQFRTQYVPFKSNIFCSWQNMINLQTDAGP